MKSLVEYITESENNVIKELFEQIDNRLNHQEWDEIAPLIEQIFKTKWGKTIKLDDSFRKKIDDGGQNLLLGYNTKGKAWIIARYNAKAHGVRGAIYNGDYVRGIGMNGPTYWDRVEHTLENINAKLKLRFGDAYANDARVVTSSFDMQYYEF